MHKTGKPSFRTRRTSETSSGEHTTNTTERAELSRMSRVSGWTCKSKVDRRAMTAVGGDRVLRF